MLNKRRGQLELATKPHLIPVTSCLKKYGFILKNVYIMIYVFSINLTIYPLGYLQLSGSQKILNFLFLCFYFAPCADASLPNELATAALRLFFNRISLSF